MVFRARGLGLIPAVQPGIEGPQPMGRGNMTMSRVGPKPRLYSRRGAAPLGDDAGMVLTLEAISGTQLSGPLR